MGLLFIYNKEEGLPFIYKHKIQLVNPSGFGGRFMYRIINNSPIRLSHMDVSMEQVLEAIESANHKLKAISDYTKELSLDIFRILDLRTLSGAVGETFVGEMSRIVPGLMKNPSLDGYPDLVQCAAPEMVAYFEEYASRDSKEAFLFGGIEVKNTFGYKKTGVDLLNGEPRIGRINRRLEWKAHHQKTNYLLGLYTDYREGYPVIIAAFFSDSLIPQDWSIRAEPKGDSAMTSFSTLQVSGFKKMLSGIRVCLDDPTYLQFFHQEG